MSKFITMGAEKLQKQKCKEFCGTPCILNVFDLMNFMTVNEEIFLNFITLTVYYE